MRRLLQKLNSGRENNILIHSSLEIHDFEKRIQKQLLQTLSFYYLSYFNYSSKYHFEVSSYVQTS